MAKKKRKQKHSKLPNEFLVRLQAVTAKRAKVVIDHILEYGQVNTDELRELYSYSHPPRARQDVMDEGIPIETTRVKSKLTGRSIAAYRFGDPAKMKAGRIGGRKAWPKQFKQSLIDRDSCRCAICSTELDARYLQIDHRVPYQIAGDNASKLDPAEFMLVCGSCNRAKSWSCEHCKNWTTDLRIEVCRTCYWATPENYAHVALRLIRRLDVTWSGDEVPEYDQLLKLSKHARKKLPNFVKEVLRDRIDKDSK